MLFSFLTPPPMLCPARPLGACLIAACVALPSGAQPRSMKQDSLLNNLVHAPGTLTTPNDSLGSWVTVGRGPRTLVLIAGIGFGAQETWGEFMEASREQYTMLAATLPGFGDTPPPTMPSTPYADQAWTRNAQSGLAKLLRAREGTVTLVAHWGIAANMAVRLAVDNPERVDGVILVAAPRRVQYEGPTRMDEWTVSERARWAEGLGQRWFKTVTRLTWDDNNFMSYDYAVNPRRGLALWRQAQLPSLSTWIRYLLEWYTMDLTEDLRRIQVPVLVMQPGFDDPDFYVEPERPYMRNLTLDSWTTFDSAGTRLQVVRIPNARLFIMHDQPERFRASIAEFVSRHGR